MTDKRDDIYYENVQLTSQFKFCPNAFRIDMYRGCDFGCKYCLDGDTYVFMFDGTFKKIKNIKIGDEIYGVHKVGNHQRYIKSVVTNFWTSTKQSYKIILSNGIELICSGDHRWLTNRGWKYTIGAMGGNNKRPYLTTNNRMIGLDNLCFTDSQDTDDFKLGYLSGLIRGDGLLKYYNYSGVRRQTDDAYRFRLALKNENAINRAYDYLTYFGVSLCFGTFKMIDRNTKQELKVKSIYSNKRESYDTINNLISYKNSKEFIRGFVSGIYDAEGCKDAYCIRIYNTDDTIMSTIENGLKIFGFNFVYDKNKLTINNKTLKTIRLSGTLSDRVRFMSIFNPSIKPSLNGVALKQNESNLKIVSIEKLDSRVLYDITTTTENFIANGVVSHNCFANNQTFGELDTDLSIFRVADLERVERKFKVAFESDEPRKSVLIELMRHKVPFHCGGMADPFQTREWKLGLTKELIKLSNKYQYPICFSTKTSYLPDEYFELLDPKIHAFQVSILGWSDEFVKKWETNTSSAKERLEFVKKLRDKGFWCSVRIQPIIDYSEALELVKHLKGNVDYISVEHLHIKPKGGEKDKVMTDYVNTEDYIFVEDQWVVKKDIKIQHFKEICEIANSYGVKVGAADNDIHYLSQSRCCCGIDLINENFNNYLKFNTTYLSTGESNIDEMFIPQSNLRQHMNIGKGKPTIYFKDVVTNYIQKYPEQLGNYRESVEKQLFGVTKKKLF